MFKIGQKPKKPRKKRSASTKEKRPKTCTRREVKLDLTQPQTALLEEWLWNLTGVYNWAIRKIEQDAANKIYHSKFDFVNLLPGTSEKIGIPSKIIQQTLERAWTAWERCFNKVSKKPRLKGKSRPLTSISFPDNCEIPQAGILKLLGFRGGHQSGPVLKYKKQKAQAKHDPERRDAIDQIPKELLGAVILKKKATGWYASILVYQPPNEIPRVGFGHIGIDPGFQTLLTTSEGEKIEHPKEFYHDQERIAQAQRGGNKRLAARLNERVVRRVRDRNHKLSRKLVSENSKICYSKDNLTGMSRSLFGKSVRAAAHGQLRDMVRSKSCNSGTEYIEVASRKSTMTCCVCEALTGPTGVAGLKVRQWTCSGCGTRHDRDTNSAVLTFIVGGEVPPEEVAVLRSRYLSETCPRVLRNQHLVGIEPTSSSCP